MICSGSVIGRNSAKQAKAIIRRDGTIGEILDLLQDRIGPAIGEDVARQKQQRQTVHMRDRGSRHHVRRPRSDRARHRHHLATEARFGKGNRGMRHCLFVMCAVGRELFAHLIERLTDSCNIAVTKDCPYTSDQWHFCSVDLGHLSCEITDQCLPHGESDHFHRGIFPKGWLWRARASTSIFSRGRPGNPSEVKRSGPDTYKPEGAIVFRGAPPT